MRFAAGRPSKSRFRTISNVNVFGVMRVTKALPPTMRRQRKGRIINISSILGAEERGRRRCPGSCGGDSLESSKCCSAE
jgi:NAD(P)-dependent dehydrogenase (short-subunit alcohol dehydrogenase family)